MREQQQHRALPLGRQRRPQGHTRLTGLAHGVTPATEPAPEALRDRFSVICRILSNYQRQYVWDIEQLFRTLKRQGLGIEQSVLEDGEALEKLAMIALIGASITMQLVLARAAEGQDAPAELVFDEMQIEVLHALQAKLQGRTIKQKNPYRLGTLAWASWTIARLGGWTGYESDRSTGPITMRDGLERFNALVDGYKLAREVCPR